MPMGEFCGFSPEQRTGGVRAVPWGSYLLVEKDEQPTQK